MDDEPGNVDVKSCRVNGISANLAAIASSFMYDVFSCTVTVSIAIVGILDIIIRLNEFNMYMLHPVITAENVSGVSSVILICIIRCNIRNYCCKHYCIKMQSNTFIGQIFDHTNAIDELIHRGGEVLFLGRDVKELMWYNCTNNNMMSHTGSNISIMMIINECHGYIHMVNPTLNRMVAGNKNTLMHDIFASLAPHVYAIDANHYKSYDKRRSHMNGPCITVFYKYYINGFCIDTNHNITNDIYRHTGTDYRSPHVIYADNRILHDIVHPEYCTFFEDYLDYDMSGFRKTVEIYCAMFSTYDNITKDCAAIIATVDRNRIYQYTACEAEFVDCVLDICPPIMWKNSEVASI